MSGPGTGSKNYPPGIWTAGSVDAESALHARMRALAPAGHRAGNALAAVGLESPARRR